MRISSTTCPTRGCRRGGAGSELITGAIRDIHVEIPLIVADRIEAAGVRADNGAPMTWVENQNYRVTDGQITELWPAGGPRLS